MTYKEQEITIRLADASEGYNVTVAIGKYEEGTNDDNIYYWLDEDETPIQVGQIIADVVVVKV